MLSVTMLAVGKLKEPWMRAGYAEYEKRCAAFCKLSTIEVPEHRLSLEPSEAEIQQGLEKEMLLLEKKIPPRSKTIALCIEGTAYSSEGLAGLFADCAQQSFSPVFIIGSSFGLSAACKQAADVKLSFSAMTFPHQLMRVMLAEQVYRALSVLQGSKYHK